MGLVWDDFYQLVMLVWLGREYCTIATELEFELGTRVVVDLGGGRLALGTIVDDTHSQLTISFDKRLAKHEGCRSVPRHVLLAAGAPHHAVSLARESGYSYETQSTVRGCKIGKNATSRSRPLMLSAAIGVVLWSSVAYSETYATIGISTGVQYDSDPFLRGGEDTETASVRASVRPSLRYEDPTFRIALSGFIDHSEYVRRYDSDTAWGLDIGGSQQFDTLTSMNFSASAVTSRRGATSFITGTLPTPDGGLPDPDLGLPDPEIPDLSELGSSTRTRQLSGSLGLERKLSEIETISIGARLHDVSTSDDQTGVIDGDRDYRTGVLSMGYRRSVSPQTTVLADLQGSLVNFGSTNQGDGVVVNATGGLETALGERITARGSVGVSYSKRELANGSHEQTVTPSFAASACRRSENTNSCLSGTRAVQPTTAGRLRKVTAFGVTHSWRLNADEEVGVTGSYARNEDFRVVDEPNLTNQIIGVRATYRRKVADRLYVNVNPGLERRFGESGRDGTNNFSVNVGLSYRFGSSDE